MKTVSTIVFLIAALSVRGQTVATTSRVRHPIMKALDHRDAPTSLNQDPSMKREFANQAPGRPQPGHPALVAPAVVLLPAKPGEVVGRIDSILAASPVSLIGTISGIKGKLYVTNIGTETVTPVAQFAVCNQKGYQIGTTAKIGSALAPNETEKIEVLATNLNAVDLKLMKLSPGG